MLTLSWFSAGFRYSERMNFLSLKAPFYALALAALVAFSIVAAANGKHCDIGSCRGPVKATWTAENCGGQPDTVEQILDDNTAASGGKCIISTPSDPKSGNGWAKRWYCNPETTFEAFTLFNYSTPKCESNIPSDRATITMGQCMNGVDTQTGQAISYAFYCDAAIIGRRRLASAQTSGSPMDKWDSIHLGAAFQECNFNNTRFCEPGTPKLRSFEGTSPCRNPLSDRALFANVGPKYPPQDTCYLSGPQNAPNLPFDVSVNLNARIVCTNAEMHVLYYPKSCSIDNNLTPVMAHHYPKYDACFMNESGYSHYYCG